MHPPPHGHAASPRQPPTPSGPRGGWVGARGSPPQAVTHRAVRDVLMGRDPGRVRQLPKAAAARALRPEPCASPGLHGPRRHPLRPAGCGAAPVAVTHRCARRVRSLPERLLSERLPSHARVRVSGRPFRGGGVSRLWAAFRDSARVASRRGSLTNEPGVAVFPLSRCHTSCLGSLQTPGRRDVLPPCLLHTGFTLHVPVLWCCVVCVRGRSVLQRPENTPEPLFVGSFCFGRVCRLRPRSVAALWASRLVGGPPAPGWALRSPRASSALCTPRELADQLASFQEHPARLSMGTAWTLWIHLKGTES